MDRYDAILEAIKKAQRHGFDSLATQLEQVIVALERSLDSAKSSLENALPTDPEAVFPVSEIEAEVAAMRDQPRQAAGVGLDELRTLDGARSQSELLRALLPMLVERVGRAVVLVIRDGVVTAWSGAGLDHPDRVRGWQGGIAASPDLTQLVETALPRRFQPAGDPLLSEWLADEGLPEEAVLLPISLRGKLMGMVYVDRLADRPWNLEAAQALVAVACLLIDTLAHRPVAPSPTLAQIVAAEPPQIVEPEPEIFAAPPDEEDAGAEEARPEFASESPGEDAVGESFAPPPSEAASFEEPGGWQQPGAEDEVAIEYDFEPEPATAEPEPASEAFDPSATMRVEMNEEAPAADSISRPDFGAEPPRSLGDVGAPPPVRPIEPPPQMPGPGAAPEDDVRHEEARRFARLLVSEIKLYNEEEVDRGRTERDLAQRLKEDIDRSREMYEKRIPQEVRAGHDYFYDELVRILADGDPDALGM
jgi:hypothetical protein